MKRIDALPEEGRTDIVFVIDTTGSMRDDIQKLKKEWLPRFLCMDILCMDCVITAKVLKSLLLYPYNKLESKTCKIN